MSLENRPLAIDLFTGLHGWTEGLVAEGWRVVGFDLEDMSAQFGQPKPEHFNLVLQDVLTLNGRQFKGADLIVASPPCQFFSYTAMPWTRAKKLADEVRLDPSRLEKELALFNACFRIQREATAAAGRKIPMVVENVRGAGPWLGRARWMYGSFALYGDVPALMPMTIRAAKNPGFRFDGSGRSFQSESVDRHTKNTGGSWFNIAHNTTSGKGQNPDGRKNVGPKWDPETKSGAHGMPRWTNPAEGAKNGNDWFGSGEDCSMQRRHGSKSKGRKFASAMIAKIPLPLSRHIAATYRPAEARTP